MALQEPWLKLESAVTDCVFCNPPAGKIAAENELALALWDAFPVTALHTLIVPRRHVANWFSLVPEELLACDDLVRKVREDVEKEDSSIEGFNIGVNIGEVAGQTIFHSHIHLIPRRRGDVADPRGGVRHLIPGKGYY